MEDELKQYTEYLKAGPREWQDPALVTLMELQQLETCFAQLLKISAEIQRLFADLHRADYNVNTPLFSSGGKRLMPLLPVHATAAGAKVDDSIQVNLIHLQMIQSSVKKPINVRPVLLYLRNNYLFQGLYREHNVQQAILPVARRSEVYGTTDTFLISEVDEFYPLLPP